MLANGLKLNIDKTQYIWLGQKLTGIQEYVEPVKNLGVWIDPELKMNKHVKNVCRSSCLTASIVNHCYLQPHKQSFYGLIVEERFFQLSAKFTEMPEILSITEITLSELVKSRFKLIYGETHGTCYLLDPRFICDGSAADSRRSMEDSLKMSIPKNDNSVTTKERKIILGKELAKYVISSHKEDRQLSSF
ncbi:hypothetical protein HELRODRAFT_182511 [Helobdella robusta]|uniref:Uncharacterized protein n=1 Tax=Helobdella robusta TaxID=6412 RepID=T1FIA7_HELRO|nr:hypothetical protein HELRODRAFT_182511 [Helobdella robusta]ESN90920.1 hypothetical protein HELRODRAFT_182511 [Helobdella robusta]